MSSTLKSSNSIPSPTEAPHRLTCDACDSQFSRQDHLQRHKQTHLKQKSIKCNRCTKHFTRKDALRRHQQLHTRELNESPLSQLSISLRRTCSMCANARVKCRGGLPCDHCDKRGLNCVYLPRKRQRSQFLSDSHPSSTSPSPADFREDRSFEQGFGHEVILPVANNPLASDNVPVAILAQSPQRTAHESTQNTNGLDDHVDDNILGSEEMSEPSNANLDMHSPTNLANRWQDPMATNWLPFDSSIDIAMVYHDNAISDTNLMVEHNSNTQETVEAQGDASDSFLFQDRVSALIDTMRFGFLGDVGDFNHYRVNNTFYADGAGFRASQADLYSSKLQEAFADPAFPSNSRTQISWIAMLQNRIRKVKERKGIQFEMPDTTYHEILARLGPQGSRPRMSPDFSECQETLLQKDTFNYLIQLYFSHFHPVYPFLDRSLLCIPVWGWSLCLATSAIGTNYVGLPELADHGGNLCSTLIELLLKELDFGRIEDSLPYIQARALAALGLCQSRRFQSMRLGYNALASVYDSCLQLRLLEEDPRIGAHQEGQSLEQVWIAWRFRETRRRTGLFIWLINCNLALATESPPKMPPQNLKLKMPSAEVLWESNASREWLNILSQHTRTREDMDAILVEESMRQSVRQATEDLWNTLHVPGSITQFGNIIILHMLLRRRWDAGQYLSEPTSSLALPRSQLMNGHRGHYLGAIPEYVKLRNITCDCLDVLHRDALSLSAKAGGFESPVFLHLHLARLVLLVPVSDLLEHVNAEIPSPSIYQLPHNLYRNFENATNWQHILCVWAFQDRYKARLAVVHAGAMFWHVRRYSSTSFIEPFGIFLATLVLWAFGTAAKLQHELTATHSGESFETRSASLVDGPSLAPDYSETSTWTPSTSDLSVEQSADAGSFRKELPLKKRRMPGIMQLDRPVDDEIVQHFIRSGEGMKLFLEGVDDLCTPEGSSQVLREGASILLEEPVVWTISECYASLLENLASSSS